MCSKYQTPVVCSKAKREQAGSDHAMSFSSGHGLLQCEESVWCLSRTLPQMCLWAAASLLGASTCLEGHLPAEDSNPGSYVACTHRRKKEREREKRNNRETVRGGAQNLPDVSVSPTHCTSQHPGKRQAKAQAPLHRERMG